MLAASDRFFADTDARAAEDAKRMADLGVAQSLAHSFISTYRQPGGEDILNRVAEVFGVSVKYIKGGTRNGEIAVIRHIAMYLLRQSGLSYPQVGKAVGGRHHQTAMHAIEKIARMRASNPQLDALLKELEARP